MAAGCEIADDADTVVQVVPAEMFQTFPGRRNVLVTSWAFNVLPAAVADDLKAADLVIVPSDYCREVFAAAGIAAAVVPNGVAERFDFVDRSEREHSPTRPFRFLYFATPTPRKGYRLAFEAWHYFTEGPGCRLIDRAELVVHVSTGTQNRGIVRRGGLTIDDRPLSDEQVVRMFAAADVLICPTLGDGFGMSAAEAARTGLPVLHSGAGGLRDLFDDETGVLIPSRPDSNAWELRRSVDDIDLTNVAEATLVDVKRLAESMASMYIDRERRTHISRAASRRFESYQWPKAGAALKRLIESPRI